MTVHKVQRGAPRVSDSYASPKVPVFFEPEKLEETGLRSAERRYEPEEEIFMRGDPADRLYLLLEGVVRMCKPYGDYNQATIALLKDTGSFGEFDLFGRNRQSSSAEAMTGCRVATVRKTDLRLAMERSPALAVELFSMFSEKFYHSEATMDALLYRNTYNRLATLLVNLSEKFGEPMRPAANPGDMPSGVAEEKEPSLLDLRLTHQELAEMIAATREATTKAIGEFQKSGLISQRKGRRIVLEDRARLRDLANGAAYAPG